MNGINKTKVELNELVEVLQDTIQDYEKELKDLKETITELQKDKEALETAKARIEELESELQEKEPTTVLDQLKKEIIDRFIELPISELTFIEDMYFKGKIV